MEKSMENYYYNRMTKPERAAYHAIKKGLEALAPSVQVPRIDSKDLAQVYFCYGWIIRKFSILKDTKPGIMNTRTAWN